MTSCGFLLYPLIHALLCHHQKCFFLLQVKTNTETYSQATCKEWETWENVSIKSLPSGLRELCRRGSRKNGRVIGMESTDEPRQIIIAVHMNSWRLREHAQGLQGSGPYGVLEMKGGVDILPSLSQKPSPIKSHLQIKLKIFFTGETNHS